MSPAEVALCLMAASMVVGVFMGYWAGRHDADPRELGRVAAHARVIVAQFQDKGEISAAAIGRLAAALKEAGKL